jgi:hypothetical protein
MRVQFYHAIALSVLLGAACGRPASDTPAPAKSAPPFSSTPSAAPAPSTPTSDAIAKGKEIIERVRAAAGGAKLTAIRSLQADGTSDMSAVGRRALSIRAMFPSSYRQEEIPSAPGGLGVAIGLQGNGIGWMLGGRLGGSSDRNVLQENYNRAASQAMAGFLAGVNAPWLVDSGQFTPVAAGKVDTGDDRDLSIVAIEGPLGRAGRLLIDPGTNLPRRFIQPPQPLPGGAAGHNELSFTYSDFRAEDGVQLPHTIVRRVGNSLTTWLISKYTLNPKITAKEFSRQVAARSK